MLKRREMADKVWDKFLEMGPGSQHRASFDSAREQLKWREHFLKQILKVEADTTAQHLRALHRWEHFAGAHADLSAASLWAPPPEAVADFLGDAAKGGPTAPRSLFHSLAFARDALGMKIDLEHRLVKQYGQRQDGAVQRGRGGQAQLVSLAIFLFLHGLVKDNKGAISDFSSVVLMFVALGARYAHFLRFKPERVEGRLMFGRVNRGKSRKHGIRPPVDLAAPRTLFGQVDVGGRFIKSWVRMAKGVKPVPDFGPMSDGAPHCRTGPLPCRAR